jgi:hypothetical protein
MLFYRTRNDFLTKQNDMKKILVIAVLLSALLPAWNLPTNTKKKKEPAKVKFSSATLMRALIDSGVYFPEIVWAQSALETGNWKSSVFKFNHNLFGMKKPRLRATTAMGSLHGHAKYSGWLESVADFKLWQDHFKIDSTTTEAEYYALLKKIYCPMPTYVKVVKKIVPRARALHEEIFKLETSSLLVKF